jgi:uncharacterized membrane protein
MNWRLLILACLLLVGAAAVNAQDAPRVFAVLFYSPTCPHCHEVISNGLPPIQKEFGDRLEMLYIDASSQFGAALFYAGCEVANIPGDRCGSVPTLIIGTDYLIGSIDIPAKLPGMVRDGLAAGGIGLPPIPGLAEAYQTALEQQAARESSADTSAETAAGGLAESPTETSEVAAINTGASAVTASTWQERFARDPVGNGLSVVVLAVLALSLLAQAFDSIVRRMGWLLTLLVGLLGVGVATTLIFEGNMLALLMTLGLAGGVGAIWKVRGAYGQPDFDFPAWLPLLVIAVGLLAAGYLTVVEVSETEAVCGVVGDCNTVQQSPYARLFGVLPVGLLGLIGYVAILAAWLVSRSASGLSRFGQIALLLLTLFGVAFSLYLTFLEPFVIGATCAWCLTSALVMALLFWLQAPAGWRALRGAGRAGLSPAV